MPQPQNSTRRFLYVLALASAAVLAVDCMLHAGLAVTYTVTHLQGGSDGRVVAALAVAILMIAGLWAEVGPPPPRPYRQNVKLPRTRADDTPQTRP